MLSHMETHLTVLQTCLFNNNSYQMSARLLTFDFFRHFQWLSGTPDIRVTKLHLLSCLHETNYSYIYFNQVISVAML